MLGGIINQTKVSSKGQSTHLIPPPDCPYFLSERKKVVSYVYFRNGQGD